MDGTIVASGKIPSFEYVTTKYMEEVVHRIKVTGRIDLETRLPLYHATLAANSSCNYFCILDNSGGYENVFSYPDIVVLDNLLIESGIEYFCGATITIDPAYPDLVKLANYNAKATKLQGDLMATFDPDEAEIFIQEKISSLVG